MAVENKLVKYFDNFKGLDLRVSDLKREAGAATELSNLVTRNTGAITKRKGYQMAGTSEIGGSALTQYKKTVVSPSGDVSYENELITADKDLYKRTEESISISYSGGLSAYYTLLLDDVEEIFKFKIYEDNAEIFSRVLGTGFESAPVPISVLISAVDALPNFSMTSSSAKLSHPAALLPVQESASIYDTGTDILFTSWEKLTTVPGLDGVSPFQTHFDKRNEPDFQNLSTSVVGNCLYITGDTLPLYKYDGVRVYKAGVKGDGVFDRSLYKSFSVDYCDFEVRAFPEADGRIWQGPDQDGYEGKYAGVPLIQNKLYSSYTEEGIWEKIDENVTTQYNPSGPISLQYIVHQGEDKRVEIKYGYTYEIIDAQGNLIESDIVELPLENDVEGTDVFDEDNTTYNWAWKGDHKGENLLGENVVESSPNEAVNAPLRLEERQYRGNINNVLGIGVHEKVTAEHQFYVNHRVRYTVTPPQLIPRIEEANNYKEKGYVNRFNKFMSNMFIQDSSEFNTNMAVIAGDFTRDLVNTVPVEPGHGIKVGDNASFMDYSDSPELSLTVPEEINFGLQTYQYEPDFLSTPGVNGLGLFSRLYMGRGVRRKVSAVTDTSITFLGDPILYQPNTVVSSAIAIKVYRTKVNGNTFYYDGEFPNDTRKLPTWKEILNHVNPIREAKYQALEDEYAPLAPPEGLLAIIDASANYLEVTEYDNDTDEFYQIIDTDSTLYTDKPADHIYPVGRESVEIYGRESNGQYILSNKNTPEDDPLIGNYIAGFSDRFALPIQEYYSYTPDEYLNDIYVPPASTREPAPIGCQYMTSWRNSLILAGNKKEPTTVYFSDIDSAEIFPAVDNSFLVEPPQSGILTGIKPLENTLYAFSEQAVTAINGDLQAFAFTVDTVSEDDIGCVSQNTIKQVKDGLWFLSDKGIYSISRKGLKEESSKLDPEFEPRRNNFDYKRAAAYHWVDENKYLVNIPVTKDNGAGSLYTSDESKIYCFDTYWGGWSIWEGLDFTGGIVSYENDLLFTSRGLDDSGSETRYMYRVHDADNRFDYADHNKKISCNFAGHWETLGEPSVFKKYRRIKFISLDPSLQEIESTAFTLNVLIENNYVKEPISELVLNFGTDEGGWGEGAWGDFPWGETRLFTVKHKLAQNKFKSSRVSFSNDTINQNIIISGYELDVVAPYRAEIKE